MKCLLSALALSMGVVGSVARGVGGTPKDVILDYKREALQDIVSFSSFSCVRQCARRAAKG